MPDCCRELQDAVLEARDRAAPIGIAGSGSKSFMGRSTSLPVLSVANHSGIVSHEPSELVITARGGTTLAEIESALAEDRQCLAAESPTFSGKATIGGTLACNLSGPARPWAGSIRDHVLGIRLINGRGEHLRFGGKVMKNVAGYDVSRLQAGAMGTLGVITEVTLRVQPKAEYSTTIIRSADCADAIRQMNELSGKNLPISAACWVNGELSLRLSGDESAVRSVVKRLEGSESDDSDAFWRSIRELSHAFFTGDEPLWRFSLRSGSDSLLTEERWLIDWGGAQRWLRGEHAFESLEAEAERSAGQVTLFRGGDREGDVFHSRTAAQQSIHQRLKSAFDPAGVFNPGRLYSWM